MNTETKQQEPWRHGLWAGKNTGISIYCGSHGTAPFAVVYGPRKEAEARARLIAASPELLAACEAAKANILSYLNGEWDGNIEGWEAVMERCNAAIARAKGE